MCLEHFAGNANATPAYDAIRPESRSRLPYPELKHARACPLGCARTRGKSGRRRALYILLFVDYVTRKIDGYILKQKSEALSKFKEWKALIGRRPAT